MKRLSIYAFVITQLLGLVAGRAAAQEPLDRYLMVAAENNPGLKSRFNEYMAALEVAPRVSALPDPQVAFGYFISPVETRVGPQRARISATQMFPWFGTLTSRENEALQAAKARYEAFEEAKSRLFHEVRSNYFDLYFNAKATQIVEENISILRTFQKLALVKVEAGMASVVDQYRIEMETGDLENHLALLKDRQGFLEVSFMNLLNSDRETLLLPDTLWDDGPDLTKQALLDSILIRNHQLLGIDLQQEALKFREEAARNEGKPRFSIGLDYINVGTGDNNFTGRDAFMFPRIGITIPLYRDKYRAMVSEVVYLQAASENDRMEKSNMLETLFEESWNELLDASRRVDLYSGQQELARRSIHLLEVEYSTAGENFEEVLRMERKLLYYSLELEKARADKQAAISFMDYLRGS